MKLKISRILWYFQEPCRVIKKTWPERVTFQIEINSLFEAVEDVWLETGFQSHLLDSLKSINGFGFLDYLETWDRRWKDFNLVLHSLMSVSQYKNIRLFNALIRWNSVISQFLISDTERITFQIYYLQYCTKLLNYFTFCTSEYCCAYK